MSPPRREPSTWESSQRGPHPAVARASRLGVALPIVASLAIGCATTTRPDEPREDMVPVSEVERLREQHVTETATLREQHAQAVTDVELLRRELGRAHEERDAARQTARDHEVGLDAAMNKVREQEKELAQLRSVPAGAGNASEVGAAAELLRQQQERIKVLQDELARARAGEARQVDPKLEGRVKGASLDLEVPVATVDGEPVTRRDFVEFLYRDVGSRALLELCINRLIVEREARRRGIQVSEVQVNTWVTEQLIAHETEAGGAEQLQQKIAEAGFDLESWTARLKYQAPGALALERLVELERTTPEGRDAFEARLREEYHRSYDERVTASHIFIACPEDAEASLVEAARRKAQLAAEQVRRGVPFADVARRVSDEKATKQVGGTLGTFDKTRFARSPELNQLLFTAPEGKVTEPIRTRLGFQVVQVHKHVPAVRPFDADTRRELIGRLTKQPPSDAELQALVARLRARVAVTRTLQFD